MRVLMFNNPLTGHFLPLLPLARALRAQGHTVAFVTAASMAGSIEPEGFVHIPAGPTVEATIAEVNRRTGSDIMAKPSPAVVAEFFAGVRVDLAADEALAGARAWEPDLVMSEHCDFVGPLVAAVLKVPSAVMAIDPALEPEALVAMARVARPRYLERGLEAPGDAAPFGRWLVDLCPPSLQRGGALPALERLPLRPEPHQGTEGHSGADPVAATGRPRVLVSFSTVLASPDLGPVLRSLSALDVDLVATVGSRPTDGFGLEPGRVELVSFRPAAQLLDGVSVVVHHGGSGNTFGAAARGVPAVVVPGMAGQQRQADRLQAAGAGIALPVGKQSPESVAAAVARLLTEPSYTEAAHRLRDEIAAMPSASEVAERLAVAVS
ncbi:glycosyltransferase [Streptomyces cadmiisoli]|uniref:glycosyltransferase n=1 Tax=Streptomyces cadmiisoli TaxID=2184053 RepID=UPI003D738F8C